MPPPAILRFTSSVPVALALLRLREQAVGYNNHPQNILLDRRLDHVVRPASQFMHDWMHALLVHGIFQTICYKLLDTFIQLGINDVYQQIKAYVALWTLPRHIGHTTKQLSSMFSKKRETANRKAKTFKCLASEALSVYPILAYFVLRVLLRSGLCDAACVAFLTLADLLDVLTSVSYGVITPELTSR